MSTPRRQIIRAGPATAVATQQQQRKADQLRSRLDHERISLARWQTRLKRAFTSVEKHQKRIARLERQITQVEVQGHAAMAR